MKTGKWILGLAFALFGGFVFTASAANYAVCVGLNQYSSSYMSSANWLDGCVPDANHVWTNITQRGEWTSSSVTKLLNSAGTKSAIRKAITNYAATAVSGDVFFYYHSSHGGQNSGTSTYLCAYDNDYSDTELATDLAKFATGVKVVVMVDACHSGGLFKSIETNTVRVNIAAQFAERVMAIMEENRAELIAKGAKDVTAKIAASGIGWITAADYNQYSWDGTDGGAFTEAAITGWNEGYCDNSTYGDQDGYANFYELWNYAKDIAVGYPGEYDPDDGSSYETDAQSYNTNVLLATTAGWVGDTEPVQTAPVFNPQSAKTTTVGSTLTFSVSASGSPTYRLKNTTASSGYSFSSPTLTYTPVSADIGSQSFTFTASNSYGVATQIVTVTVNGIAPSAPANLRASATNTTSFTAAWNASTDATSYRLDVIQGTAFSSGTGGELISEGFASASPDGWTMTGIGTYSSSPYVGTTLTGSYSLKFSATGNSAVTPTFESSAESLQFWAYGNGGSGSTFAISGLVNNAWALIDTVTVATGGDTYTVELPSGTTQIGFYFTKSVNVALDDVIITAAAGTAGTWVSGYSNLTVSGTSQNVSGLSAGTAYAFRVRAVNSYGTSANSSVATVTTVAQDSEPEWSAIPAQSVNVGETLSLELSGYVAASPAATISLSSSTAAAADYEYENGLLVFEPTAAGTFTFTFNATNSMGSASQTLTVTATATAPSFTSGTSYSATVGEPMSFTATATGIPTPVVALTSSTAPADDYAAEAGYVVFTPSAVGVYTFTFSATNVAGSASQTVTVTVTPAPVTVPTLTLSSATAGGFTAGWTACDGVSTYTLQVATDNAFSSGGSGASVPLLNNAATTPATVPEGWTYNLSSSTAKYLQMLTTANYVQSPAFSTANLTALTLTLKARTYGGTSGTSSNLLVQYSTDGGTTWTELGTVSAANSTLTEKTLDAAACLGNASVCLKWSVPGATSSKGMGMSSIVLTGTESAGGGSLVVNETVSATSYAVTGLSASTLYYARVQGASDWSSVQSITTLASGGGGGGDTNAPIEETAYEQWLAGQGLNVTDYPQSGEADNGEMQNWEAYVADLDPSDPTAVLALDVTETAVASTDEVALTFPASSDRYYQLVYKTNLLGASMTNNLGWGTTNMVVTNALPSGEWFGEIRVLLNEP